MRPPDFARWGTDPQETLEVFLRATLVGLLELRWELLCPSCRGAKASAEHLRELGGPGYCPACNLHFVADIDEVIEVRFYPHPAIRRAEVGTYCVGGPYRTRHILAQCELPPGEAREVPAPVAPGVYRWRTRQRPERGTFAVDPAAASGICSDDAANTGAIQCQANCETTPRVEPKADGVRNRSHG